MKYRFTGIFFSLCTVIASSQLNALEISSVIVDKQVLLPSKNKYFSVRFKLDEKSHVFLNIYDERDYRVRHIDIGSLSAGEQEARWDLKDNKGKLVPPEIYHYTLHAINDKKEEILYDLTDITGKEPLVGVQVQWDPERKKITYSLPSPSCIGIRAGLDDRGPLLNNVVNWLPRQAGVHEEDWDGFDASGVLDLTRHPHLLLIADAYTLPGNTVFVLPDATPPHIQKVQFTNNVDVDQNNLPVRRKIQVVSKKQMHAHSQQTVEARGDFAISLKPVGATQKNSEGEWILGGDVSFVLDVEPELVDRLINQRFEQSFYVDGRYHFENEVGVLPITFRWNSREYSEGLHYITANLRGYEGNFGMATVKVFVKQDN